MTKKRGRRKCSYKKIQIKDKLRKRKQRLARRLSSKLGITQEIEHLPTSEIGITQEIEHLSTSELGKTQEREHLSTNEIGITQEIEHLSTSELGITQEREHLPTSEIGITQEIEHLSTSELGIAQERENLPTSELGITQEREHLSNSELEITEKEKKKNKVFSRLRDKIQKRRERDRARYLSKKLAREKENKEKRQGIQWSSTGDSTMKVKRQSPATKAKKNKVYRATVLKSRMETAKGIQTKVKKNKKMEDASTTFPDEVSKSRKRKTSLMSSSIYVSKSRRMKDASTSFPIDVRKTRKRKASPMSSSKDEEVKGKKRAVKSSQKRRVTPERKQDDELSSSVSDDETDDSDDEIAPGLVRLAIPWDVNPQFKCLYREQDQVE